LIVEKKKDRRLHNSGSEKKKNSIIRFGFKKRGGRDNLGLRVGKKCSSHAGVRGKFPGSGATHKKMP